MWLIILLLAIVFIWDFAEIAVRNRETNERFEKKKHQWKFTKVDKN